MATPLQSRIEAERLRPRIVQLWQALVSLKTVVSFMNTGAHPDDETSAMLAALRFRDGIDISFACANRGEGGQNDIGTETTEALGVLRTAEMERAAEVLDLRLYWLSKTTDDSIFDFGFSKSGEETLRKWGRDRTLARFVHILRRERPDIICPTFLDVPGQHGHHRAMTAAAHEVIDLAADPAFRGSDLPPWQVKKLYLPAWSGAGQSYDDDLPPPRATLKVEGKGLDPVTGWSFERIGQQSRAFHRTQGMGHWVAAGDERDWPLHLARSAVSGPDDTVASGLAKTLRDLDLPEAQDAMDAAVAAFPDYTAILEHASHAHGIVATALDGPDREHRHKLDRKREQLARIIRLAAGVEAVGRIGQTRLCPGDRTSLEIETRTGAAASVEVSVALPDGWSLGDGSIALGRDAGISDSYPDTWLPDAPRPPCLVVSVTAFGQQSKTHLSLEEPPTVEPPRTADIDPRTDVLNLQAPRSVSTHVVAHSGGVPTLTAPEGWTVSKEGTKVTLTRPGSLTAGRISLLPTMDGAQAQSVRPITYPHIPPRNLLRKASFELQVIDAAIPQSRIGYIGSNDRVGHWLERMGCRVTSLTVADLQDASTLASLDTIVIGIFALRFCPGLIETMPLLRDWVEAGGTLVTLYHRPWDNWDADTTPPRRLEIGQPSLRWRVTDETAPVGTLEPEHPLLTTPNRIGAEDWDGWHKERGLYFAKSWDDGYIPLLEMADPGEAPLQGALLSGDIGKGRHVHTSLILHHQMEMLVPGAFRLMANLVTPRE